MSHRNYTNYEQPGPNRNVNNTRDNNVQNFDPALNQTVESNSPFQLGASVETPRH